MSKYNVVCLKWGNKYNANYVNILYNMVKRNVTFDIDFYCITDDKTNIDPEILSIDIPDKQYIGWWIKPQLFKKNIFDKPTLYLDLDVVIHNNIDKLFVDSEICLVNDFIDRNSFNTSVIFFRPDKTNFIYDSFYNNIKIFEKLPSDQEGLSIVIKNSMVHSVYPKDWIWSFKLSKKITSNSCISVFHGKPNPHELPFNQFVKTYWR